LAIVSAAGSLTQMVFDAVGNLLSETDPNNDPPTTHQYDTLNRLFQTVQNLDGESVVTGYGYDRNDRPSQVSAPNGATTQHVHDDLGNRLQETSADRGTTFYSYDTAGNRTGHTDAVGNNATYTYDALNRLTDVVYGDPQADVHYTYDTGTNCPFGLGRLCRVVDGGGTTTYGYDGFGNATRTTRNEAGRSYVTRYTHDPQDRPLNLTYPGGRVVTYLRDGVGRISQITAPVNGIATSLVSNRTYWADGLVTSQTFGNGLSDVRAYDLQGRLTSQSLGGRYYGYDVNGNLISLYAPPTIASHTYDALDRLLQVASLTGGQSFGYDVNGNRTRLGSKIYIYAPQSNRLTKVGNQTVTLDAAGNTLSDQNGARSFTYDPAGRLALFYSAGGITQYRYDAQNLRTRKTVGFGTATVYHYDLRGRLLMETQSNGTLLRAYVWDDEGPVAQIDRNPTTGVETLVYLHTDHLGTPRLATNQSGTVVWRWEGHAFGESLPNEDGDGDGNKTIINLRYAGQYFDSETGLHYWGSRYYDPKTGRGIQPDRMSVAQHVRRWRRNLGTPSQHPLEINPYVYVANNPLRWTDPTGFALCIDGTWELLDEIIAPGAAATFVCKCRFVCKTCDGRYTGITSDVLGTPTSPNWGKPNADWEKGKGGSGRPRPRPGDPTGCECETPEGATGCKTCSAYDAGPAPKIGGDR
jgi:RHS repeat-associated protein